MLLYESIRDELTREIVSGQLAVQEPFPSMRHLCDRFKVSHITILHVFRELQDQGFIERKGRGYEICRQCAAQPMESADGSISDLPIGLFLRPFRAHSSDNYFNEINLAIENELSFACKYSLRGFMTREFNYKIDFSQDDCREMLRHLLELDGRSSGVLIDERVPDCVLEQYLAQRHRPAVLVNRPSSLPISSISISAEESAELLWSKARQLGYTDIILCGNPKMLYANDGLFYQACVALAERDEFSGQHLHVVRNDGHSVMTIMKGLLKKLEGVLPGGRPFLLFLVNEQAFQFLDFMGDKPYQVGQDYGVCGYYMSDDLRHTPSLSTVRVNVSHMGFSAVRMLLDQCNHPWDSKIQEVHCPLDFVLGETT